MQLTAPDDLRGRVMSLYTLVYGGVFPLGAFLVGSISQVWGVSTAFICLGSFGLLTLAAVAVWWWRRGGGLAVTSAEFEPVFDCGRVFASVFRSLEVPAAQRIGRDQNTKPKAQVVSWRLARLNAPGRRFRVVILSPCGFLPLW